MEHSLYPPPPPMPLCLPATERACQDIGWIDLEVPSEELRPEFSLTMGQCFNWRRATVDCWVGVVGSRVLALRLLIQSHFWRAQ
ncbi:unnamed protein product [Choristocarpus tenellus]